MKPHRSALDWLLEAAALTALLTTLAVTFSYYPDLPDRIPQHFDASGTPNRWGDRNGIWTMPTVAVVMYFSLSLASFFPMKWNLPQGVDRQSPEVLGLVVKMLLLLKVCVEFLFAYIAWTQIQVAFGLAAGLGRWFLPAVLAITLVPVFYLVKLRKLKT